MKGSSITLLCCLQPEPLQPLVPQIQRLRLCDSIGASFSAGTSAVPPASSALAAIAISLNSSAASPTLRSNSLLCSTQPSESLAHQLKRLRSSNPLGTDESLVNDTAECDGYECVAPSSIGVGCVADVPQAVDIVRVRTTVFEELPLPFQALVNRCFMKVSCSIGFVWTVPQRIPDDV